MSIKVKRNMILSQLVIGTKFNFKGRKDEFVYDGKKKNCYCYTHRVYGHLWSETDRNVEVFEFIQDNQLMIF